MQRNMRHTCHSTGFCTAAGNTVCGHSALKANEMERYVDAILVALRQADLGHVFQRCLDLKQEHLHDGVFYWFVLVIVVV